MNLICHNERCKFCEKEHCLHPRKVINEFGACDNIYDKGIPREKIYMEDSEKETLPLEHRGLV